MGRISCDIPGRVRIPHIQSYLITSDQRRHSNINVRTGETCSLEMYAWRLYRESAELVWHLHHFTRSLHALQTAVRILSSWSESAAVSAIRMIPALWMTSPTMQFMVQSVMTITLQTRSVACGLNDMQN